MITKSRVGKKTLLALLIDSGGCSSLLIPSAIVCVQDMLHVPSLQAWA